MAKKNILFILMCMTAFLLSCAVPRYLIVPDRPSRETPDVQFPGIDLLLTTFSVSHTSSKDDASEIDLLNSRFREYIRSQNLFNGIYDVTRYSEPLKSQSYITMDVQINLERTINRTYIFDILYIYPGMGAWPIVPMWGTTKVSIIANINNKYKKNITIISSESKKDYSILFYSWYRVAPVEDAFRSAFQEAFDKFSTALSQNQSLIVAGAGTPTQIVSQQATPVAQVSDPNLPQKRKVNIALLELEGKNVQPTEASIISDILRESMFKTSRFQVLERNEMNQILKEQGFQQTGCTETSCAVEIGKMLNVEYMMVGSVSRLGGTFIVNVRMVELHSGSVKVAESVDYKGEIEGLANVMSELSRRIANQIN